jgi:hypothetical protein
MYYTLKHLTPNLIFVKWFRHPDDTENRHLDMDYVKDLRTRMDAAESPLFFLSDLRQGRIENIRIVQRLALLTNHANYGGGVAFSKRDLSANMMVGLFSRFTENDKGERVFFETLEQALARLEEMQPGVTAAVDWKAFVEEYFAPTT